MKTLDELKIGDKLALVYKYDLNYSCDTTFEIVDLIYKENGTISIELNESWHFRRFISGVNPELVSITDNVNIKHILTPVENYKYIQGIFNMGYVVGTDETKGNIRHALGIY